jgi:Lrp/AsnC family leucine-responsive transcriptional regulator
MFGQGGGDAGRLIRFDNDDDCGRRQPGFQSRRHRAGETTDAGLDEQMRWPGITCRGDLIANLGSDNSITRHHVSDDRVGGIIGSVGDKNPLAGARRLGGDFDGVVKSAVHPSNISALRPDPAGAIGGNAGMQINVRGRAGKAGGGGDGKTMIARAGADQRGQGAAVSGIAKPRDISLGDSGERAKAGIGAAQRFETAEIAAPLVLGEYLRQAEFPGQIGQIEQRRRRIGRRESDEFAGDVVGALARGGRDIHPPILIQDGAGGRRNQARQRLFSPIFGLSMPISASLDDFDRALLAQVQVNNQMPARQLAEKIGLSESAVLRRLRRLRSEGVIAADVSIVSPSVLGLPLTIHVLVSLERESAALLDAFTRKLRGRPEVRQAWYVTGEADCVLLLQLAGMEAYEGFAREMFHDDPNVRAFRTIVSMREIVGPNHSKPQRAVPAP